MIAWLALLVSSCGGGGGGGSGSNTLVGTEQPKPGGGTYFVDANRGGQATRLRIREMQWGRLVDIHDVDVNGVTSLEPEFRDLVVNENRITDGSNYILERNPATQQTRLVIRRTRGEPDSGTGTFEDLLDEAMSSLPAIAPKHDDGTSPEPFPLVPRNATIVVIFDDLMDDGAQAQSVLNDSVRVISGYPPQVPGTTRLLFDPNHGGVAGGAFHSTRLLIDPTITEAEANAMADPLPLNALGFPASRTNTNQPNLSLRIPTRVDPGSGQFFLLRGLSGGALATDNNGPIDLTSPTADVVRAMRTGNFEDLNNGFLLDPVLPQVVGEWESTILGAVEGGGVGAPGTRFVLALRFETVCRIQPRAGDIILAGGTFLEITEDAGPLDGNGVATDLRVRVISGDPVLNPNALLGSVAFLTPYEAGSSAPPGCWLKFVPDAGSPPVGDIVPQVQVIARFSEPMDPDSMRPFDTFRLIRGIAGTDDLPRNVVIGSLVPSLDLTQYTFVPLLPLSTNSGPSYTGQLIGGTNGVTDLAGNRLRDAIPEVEFALDPAVPPQRNGGLAMRFASPDDLAPIGALDIRGQGFFDTDREILEPRPASTFSVSADRGVPIVGLMTPFPPGLQTPLTPLGSKLQAVWRYADVGWQVRDESKYNMDVVGISWSPIGGLVISDFYEQFEIRMAHCRKLPDEEFRGQGPFYPTSGIGKSGGGGCQSSQPGIAYVDNVLGGATEGQKIVHPRQLGYRIDPANLYLNANGTILMPYPLNEGPTPIESYTWRDTAALGKGGIGGAGIPMDIEVGSPLFLEQGTGSVASPGLVPSIGLPLLWEIRCYPSNSGIGLNPLDVSIPINTFCEPSFRAFSSGGFDTTGSAVIKDPDLELFPSGGFNPSSNPPGAATQLDTDSIFYIGELDVAIRVSRAHLIWLDTALPSPRFLAPVTEPSSNLQPPGTQIVVEYRGADSFAGNLLLEPFDAQQMDAYGDLGEFDVNFFNGDRTWTEDIQDLDGARYIQLRISFFNNIVSGQCAILDSLGLAWEE